MELIIFIVICFGLGVALLVLSVREALRNAGGNRRFPRDSILNAALGPFALCFYGVGMIVFGSIGISLV